VIPFSPERSLTSFRDIFYFADDTIAILHGNQGSFTCIHVSSRLSPKRSTT
jgi:hypothetical protein